MRPSIVLPLLVLALTACASGDKAGGSGAPVTLRIGTDDVPGRPAAAAIDELARQARAVSGGRIRIIGVWNAAGTGVRGWDQHVARMVSAGKLDMGLIPTRAWDTEGATTLRALDAPLLVTSDALVARIVTSDLAGRILAGLDRAGVVGIALLPEGLRHPFGFGAPLASPADFAGKTVRVPRSDVSYAIYRRLRAVPEDVTGREFTQRSSDGSVAGADSSYALALTTLPRPAIATGNVTLYPKVDSLVVNRRAWDALGDRGRSQLRDAARRTVARLVHTLQPDAAAARDYCRRGGQVVLAAPADVAAIQAVVRPVYAQLERDAVTKALIADIRRLARGVPAPAAASACGAAERSGGNVAAASDPHVLDGVWRLQLDYDDGLAAGLPPDTAASELGVQTIRMDGGSYDWSWRARDGAHDCLGRYVVGGDRVTFDDAGPCDGSWEAAYHLDGAGTLRWSRVRTHDRGDVVDQALRELLHRRWTRISGPVAFPEGVYRADLPASFLLAHGLDAATARDNGGLQTMTFKHGRWLGHTDGAPTNPPDCGGRYSVTGGRVKVVVDAGPQCGTAAGGRLFIARWTLRSGQLLLTGFNDAFGQVFWGGKPWRKIG